MKNDKKLHLNLRSQALRQDAGGHNYWEEVITKKAFPAIETAILICDMWDKHWSRGASERVDIMAPRMNGVIKAARAMGVQIIHAPSDTMEYYAGTPARQRVVNAPPIAPPAPVEHPNPPLPIDDSDGGSDTGEKAGYRAWSRQHPAIEIDQGKDAISDGGQEVYSFMQQRGIRNLLIMGVHTNMCILNRTFAIKQMVKWGVNVALIRDLTDAMYNPAMPPYVDHDEGTRLVVEYIEKFWCPSIGSEDLTNE
jgi:nicotinamidase-related amidase